LRGYNSICTEGKSNIVKEGYEHSTLYGREFKGVFIDRKLNPHLLEKFTILPRYLTFGPNNNVSLEGSVIVLKGNNQRYFKDIKKRLSNLKQPLYTEEVSEDGEIYYLPNFIISSLLQPGRLIGRIELAVSSIDRSLKTEHDPCSRYHKNSKIFREVCEEVAYELLESLHVQGYTEEDLKGISKNCATSVFSVSKEYTDVCDFRGLSRVKVCPQMESERLSLSGVNKSVFMSFLTIIVSTLVTLIIN
tara:strand:- start:1173 stop:1913 length:741 start_codon:yes stop_codon:yes gene_type:complete